MDNSQKPKRQTISLLQFNRMINTEEQARSWFEDTRWPNGRCCPRCGSTDTREVKGERPMPYFCRDCKTYFSARTQTNMENSKLPFLVWVHAMYLFTTNLKGVAASKIAQDLGITKKSAWFMLHRIRKMWAEIPVTRFEGPVEVDETVIGGKRKNMHAKKREKLKGRGTAGKAAIIGAIDRKTGQVVTQAIENADRKTLHRFVEEVSTEDAKIYTDQLSAYKEMNREHESVNHGGGEYVRGDVHTNTIESFWGMYKRGHIGIYHFISDKHRHRYAAEFAGRKNVRNLDTIDQLKMIIMVETARRLMYKELTSGEHISGPKKKNT